MAAKKNSKKDINPCETGKVHHHEQIVRLILALGR